MNAELIEPRIGTARNNQQYQLASLQRSGARISFGSDWPVTSQVPLEALAVPSHRTAPESDVAWSPEESISVEESLTHYTADAAYSNFWNKGVIAVGADADFVVLDQNPLKTKPKQIRSVKVDQVYARGLLKRNKKLN
ncbi:MAG: hypothetical protein RLZ46_527 [Actinomycetota bacterium]